MMIIFGLSMLRLKEISAAVIILKTRLMKTVILICLLLMAMGDGLLKEMEA